MITSPQNPRIKAAVRLRDSRHRRKQRRLLIDGIREIHRAVAAGFELAEVFFCRDKCNEAQLQAVESIWADLQREPDEVSPEVFEKLAFGDRAEGVVAVAEMRELSLDSLTLPKGPLVAVIEGVEKPGNVGAVIRSADAAGVSAVIVADGGTDLFNPNTIRASLGTIFSLSVCAATAEETLAWLWRHKMAIFAARVDGAVDYADVDYRRPAAIVLGSEAKGLSAVWSGDDITAVSLPMCGEADSLNLSAAAAVLFYEALRQRRARPSGES
jgi:RNA methyltransferase, TrmH family